MNKSKDTCTIYDKYFIDDLLEYNLSLINNKLKLVYSNKKAVDIDTTKVKKELIKCINSTKSINKKPLTSNCWYPVFIDLKNNSTKYNLLNSGSMSNSDTLGIDDAITFEPVFQNWTVSGSAKMSIDWIINSFYSPYLQHSGILCWYKESESDFLPGPNFYIIPQDCVLIPKKTLSYTILNSKKIKQTIKISPFDKVVKINNNSLRIIGASSQVFDPKTKRFIFQEVNEIFNIDTFLSVNYPRQNNESDDAYRTRLSRAIQNDLAFDISGATNSRQPNWLFPSSKKDISLHIANGDSYSYFQSESDKVEAFRARSYSETYISPTLYPIYREIFNILTINLKKELTVSLTNGQWRGLHKLACFLSTHPDIDRTTVNVLTHDAIQLYISQKYINTKPTSIETETQNIYDAISFITQYFRDLSTDIKQTNNHTTIVRTESQLFARLLSKYSAKLSIVGSSSILTFKNKLKYGAHVRVDQDIVSLGDRNSNNLTLYNNFLFNIGNYQVSSNITNNTANIAIKNQRAPERTTIPLWDLQKKRYPADTLFSAGKDLIITLKAENNGEMIYRLEEEDKSILIGGGVISEGEKTDVLWTRTAGPDCLRFSDGNLSTIRSEGGFSGNTGTTLVTADGLGASIANPIGPSSSSANPPISSLGLRYESSTDDIPILYIRSRGKYTIRVRLKSSVGIFYDTKVIYVVDENGFYDDTKTKPRITQGKPIPVEPKNQIVSICPNLRSFAVSKNGYFWPKDSDVNIKVRGNFAFGQIFPFGGNIYKYNIPLSKGAGDERLYETEPAQLSLSYIPNNTKILISSITLINMMDNNDDCNKCESFFKNLIDNRGHILDLNDGFTLIQDPLPGDTKSKEYDFSFGGSISTDNAKIYAYGGFDENIVTTLEAKLPYHYPYKSQLPAITGAEYIGPTDPKTGATKQLCYLKSIQKYENGIDFDKGCFHPSSGWIVPASSTDPNYSKYAVDIPELSNKTAVINFDAAHRKTFVFKGAGFFDLTTANNEVGSSPKVYRSDITIGIHPKAQEALQTDDGRPTKEELIAAETSEIMDHSVNMGYRDSSGSFSKTKIINSDEFDTDIVLQAGDGVQSNEYCVEESSQSYQVSYLLTKRGPYVFPDSARKPSDPDGIPTRFEKSIGSATIEDLEVEINFVNYVNTKNMIIWLDMYPCQGVSEDLSDEKRDQWSHRSTSPKMQNSVFDSYSYSDTVSKISGMPEGPIKDYVSSLFDMNKVTRLYLLNQEHVEGNRYNFSLRFSDNANQYTTSNNSNFTEHIDPQQLKAVEKDGIVHLLPTVAPSGYSDVEVQFFRKILQTNGLETINNKFMKFSGFKLFQGGGDFKQDTRGSTTFSLGIAIVNPSVEMVPYDNISNIDISSGVDQTIVSNRSLLLANSICSWNLILHVNANGSSCNRFRPDGAMGNLTYKYNLSPNIPGYSFIANFKDKKFLLPPMNLNAPYSSLLDSNLCKYTQERLSTPVFNYSTLQILPIINIGAPFTAVGAIAAAASVDAQLENLTRGIVAYLTQLRRQAQAEVYSRNLYIPKYDKFPMGGSDKVLLAVSKDGALWYKLEASIFKYSNCPIIKKKKFTYLKLNYKTARSLAIFNFTKLESIDQFFDIDTDNIKSVFIQIDDIKNLSNMTSSNLQIILNQYIEQKNRLVQRLNNAKSEAEAQNLSIEISKLNILIQQYGQTIDSIGFRIKKFDMVSIVQNEKVNEKTAGLYVVLSDSTDKEPEDPIRIDTPGKIKIHYLLNKLRKDNLINLDQIVFETVKNKEGKPVLKIKNNLIAVNGLRPFYFFDANDEVTIIRPLSDYLAELRASGKLSDSQLADKLEAEVAEIKRALDLAIKNKQFELAKTLDQQLWDKTNILSTNKILNKGYSFTKEGYKTILELVSPPTGQSISMSPEQSTVAMIYDSNFTTIEDEEKRPFSKWSFVDNSNSQVKGNRAPEIDISTFGEHSYGTGSVLVNPPNITYKEINNEIPSLEEYIGSDYTPCKRNVTMYFNNNTEDPIVSSIIGYNYLLEDILYIQNTLDNTIELNSYNIPINLKKFFKNNHTFTSIKDRSGLMDVRSEIFSGYESSTIPDHGTVELDLGLEANYPSYAFTSQQANTIQTRINFLISNRLQVSISRCPEASKAECIKRLINNFNINSGSINDLQVFLENSSYIIGNQREIFLKIQSAKNKLNNLNNELANIYTYCEIGKITLREEIDKDTKKIICVPYKGTTALPLNTIDIKITTDNQLEFIESANNDDYWINIDPEQSCSIDFSETPKILVETELECLPLSDVSTSSAPAVCPTRPVQITSESADEKIEAAASRTVKYKITTKQFDAQVNQYKQKNPKLQWDGTPDAITDRSYIYIITRYFTLNLAGSERNALIKSTEKYFLPTIVKDTSDHTVADGEVNNKVKNIFNLDNINKLKVKFKRIPRKIKNIDMLFEIYRPNALGQLTKSITPAPGGPIDTTPRIWRCYDTKTGLEVEPTRQFKWMNEMIFRGYYGSLDAAEFKGSERAESKEISDWIPYDYL